MVRAHRQLMSYPLIKVPRVSKTLLSLFRFTENSIDFAVDHIDPLSEISSLADSGEENGKVLPSSNSSSRKRKRPSSEGGSQSGIEFRNKPLLRFPEIVKDENPPHDAAVDRENNPNPYAVSEDQTMSDVGATYPAGNNEAPSAPHLLLVKQQSKKGKRKGKKVKDENSGALGSTIQGASIQSDTNGTVEGEYSNGEDAELEEGGDDGEVDTTTRNEEGCE